MDKHDVSRKRKSDLTHINKPYHRASEVDEQFITDLKENEKINNFIIFIYIRKEKK